MQTKEILKKPFIFNLECDVNGVQKIITDNDFSNEGNHVTSLIRIRRILPDPIDDYGLYKCFNGMCEINNQLITCAASSLINMKENNVLDIPYECLITDIKNFKVKLKNNSEIKIILFFKNPNPSLLIG